MKNITQWQHLIKNYLWTILFFLGMGVLAILTMEPNIKGIASIFFFIALVIIPVGNYLSWKRKS